ncbi:hypothetical protein DPMN_176626 [Dreissena polymorpha]|uniref:Uncharacterized protein n=1 Tax=Dreissena polymorpha TaxID=45954 RepID=A0A9D4E791_DREPO|nr:hypothetical protein DPMN_176626 [Dreissena polymorpha]
MSTKYDHMESGRGPFLIDLDAPVSALADGEASTKEGQIGPGSPTEVSCPAVDSVESELSSDASYTSFTTENQLTPASCVDDDGDSSWAAYGNI